MHIPTIKELTSTYSIDELVSAEEALLEEHSPAIEIGGDDEGEKLTHVLAAIWILRKMGEDAGLSFSQAVRDYTRKVRTSISSD